MAVNRLQCTCYLRVESYVELILAGTPGQAAHSFNAMPARAKHGICAAQPRNLDVS